MTGRRLRILVLVWAMKAGGSQSFVATLLAHLDRERFEPTLAVMHDKASDYPIPEDVAITVVTAQSRVTPTVDIGLPPEIANDPALGADWVSATIDRIAGLVEALAPDVVLVTPEYPAVLAATAATAFPDDVRLVCRIPAFPSAAFPAEGGHPLYAFLARSQLCTADVLVVNSQALAQDLRDNFGVEHEGLSVLANPLDIARIQREAREEVAEMDLSRGETVLYAGRLERIKDPETLVRAMKIVAQATSARCVFLGEGSQLEYLRALAKRLGIADRVHFLGPQTNPFRFMSKSSVFVLPSVSEGMPNVLLEAMACGCPVVATDVPGGIVREILADGEYGVIVPCADPEALASGILAVLSDETVAAEYAHRSLAGAKKYDAPVAVAAYERLFLELSDKPTRQRRRINPAPTGEAVPVYSRTARMRERAHRALGLIGRTVRGRARKARAEGPVEGAFPVGQSPCDHAWFNREAQFVVLAVDYGESAAVREFVGALTLARHQDDVSGMVLGSRDPAVDDGGMSDAIDYVSEPGCLEAGVRCAAALVYLPKSRVAGVPAVVRTAITAGCLVITTHVSEELRDFDQSGRVVLVPRGDAQALAEAMLVAVWARPSS